MNLDSLKRALNLESIRRLRLGYTPKKKELRMKTRQEIKIKQRLSLKDWMESVVYNIESATLPRG
jgi:hypothetical protein